MNDLRHYRQRLFFAGIIIISMIAFLSTASTGIAQAPTPTIIASEISTGSALNLLSYHNPYHNAFSSSDDAFQIMAIGTDIPSNGTVAFPSTLLDESLSSFSADKQGIIDSSSDFTPFFGVADTVNSDTAGLLQASWTFAIAGASNMNLYIDVAAMGDFEANDDSFEFRYSVDGNLPITAFTALPDEDRNQVYTMANGETVSLDDPLLVDGVLLNNEFTTFGVAIPETGSTFTLLFSASTDGDEEAFAFRNIRLTGDLSDVMPPPAPPPPPMPRAEISQTNGAPIAENDFYLTDENTALVIDADGVLANDNDPDGNSLTVANSDTLSANRGIVRVDADGSFTYTPPSDYFGLDRFAYVATDGDLLSEIAWVYITVNYVPDATQTIEALETETPELSGTAEATPEITAIVTPEASETAIAPVCEIIGFELWDAESDIVISPLLDGEALDLAVLRDTPLTIVAITDTSATASVSFTLSGAVDYTSTENSVSYSLFGDTEGDHNGQQLAIGAYSLLAEAYTEDNAEGDLCADATISFTVVDSTPVPEITGFLLVNADTDTIIGTLDDGDIVDVDLIGTRNLNIIAEANNAESVIFSGSFPIRENEAPYTALGNVDGDYLGTEMADGSYSVTASAYSADYGDGLASVPVTINFTVTSTPEVGVNVTGFFLVNADTDTIIGALADGDSIDADLIGTHNLNIIAEADGAESVVFSGSFSNTENELPYTLAGNTDGDYWHIDMADGHYTVTATAYTEDDGNGIAGTPATINFTITSASSS